MEVLEIAKLIENHGGRLYLVGGALRDKLLNRPIFDEDYCVVGLEKQDFLELFPNAHIRGKAFEVFDLNGHEFALARTEKKIGKGHKEFEITTNKNITIEEDLLRRDITINSIAQDVLTKEIIDPFNGQEDLKNKIIRATSISFKEDPLRVYRVARFASELNFKVEKSTIQMMNELKGELNSLSKERVFCEFRKALATEKPSIFFNVLKEAKVLEIHFKEINALIGVEQPIQYHPEGDAYNHTMCVLDMAANLTEKYEFNRKLEIRFSALVHDLGKGTTPKAMYPHHYGHEERGVELVRKFSKRIGLPNAWNRCGKTACIEHMRGGIFYKMKPAKKVEFIERVDKSLLGLDGLQIIVISDKMSGGRKKDMENIDFEKIGKECLKEINGEYIKKRYKIENGIQFRKKLHEERVKWMQDIEKNN